MLVVISVCFFFFKQKTAYEMRISDWSSDVCSSDLPDEREHRSRQGRRGPIASGLEVAGPELSDPPGGRCPQEAQKAHKCEASKPLLCLEIGRASCKERVCQYV